MIATHPATTVRWQRQVPQELCALDTMGGEFDYADVFSGTLAEDVDTSIDVWFRERLRNAPANVRRTLQFALLVQRSVLGLRIDPTKPAHDTLLGWRVAASEHDWCRLEAASPLMSGHLVFLRQGRRVSCATFVRYNKRAAAWIWPPVSLAHRWVGLTLMRHAVQAGA